MGILDLFRLDELYAMVRVKRAWSKLNLAFGEDQEDLKFCYHILKHVSRSFAAVIMQLHDEMRDAICIFYLVLRALDTIEDDMDIPVALKKKELPIFHKKLLDNTWSIDGIGKAEEKTLLQQFYRVTRVFQGLKKEYQEVISDICERMANGMCHFLENSVSSKADYDLYCHYVAGLVGHGLTRLFANSGLESPKLADDLTDANHMGLFLQKTNIIRDYMEDLSENPPRMFWPKDIWGNFAEALPDFKDPKNLHQGLECLNAMVADALQHLPHVIDYMMSLKHPSIFLFCAIPQVMAIATLEEVYNNPKIFLPGKVKIRKGLACKIMLQCGDIRSALIQTNVHRTSLEKKLKEEDPSYDVTSALLKEGKAKISSVVGEVSYARSFITKYPALGGELLYTVVDGLKGYFHRQ